MAARVLEFWKKYSDLVHAGFSTAWIGIGYGTLFALRERQEEITLWRGNSPIEVDKDTLSMSKELVDEVTQSCKAPGDQDPLLLTPFVTVGSEAVSLGSVKNRFGGVVGVPYSWRYSNSQDIESIDIAPCRKATSNLTKYMVTLGEYVYAPPKSSKYNVLTTKNLHCYVERTDENSQAMDALKDSLIVSDQAKSFAYLREIGHLNSHHQNVVVGIGVLSICMGGTFGYVAQMLLQMKPVIKPGPMLAIVVLAHAAAYMISLDFFKSSMDSYLKKRDAKIEEDLVKKGFVKGGIEFYEKLIQKNISLRALLGGLGEGVYTEDGNEMYPDYRCPHLPLTQLRDNLVKQQDSEALDE